MLSSGHAIAITKNLISQQLQQPKLGRPKNGPANSQSWIRKDSWDAYLFPAELLATDGIWGAGKTVTVFSCILKSEPMIL